LSHTNLNGGQKLTPTQIYVSGAVPGKKYAEFKLKDANIGPLRDAMTGLFSAPQNFNAMMVFFASPEGVCDPAVANCAPICRNTTGTFGPCLSLDRNNDVSLWPNQATFPTSDPRVLQGPIQPWMLGAAEGFLNSPNSFDFLPILPSVFPSEELPPGPLGSLCANGGPCKHYDAEMKVALAPEGIKMENTSLVLPLSIHFSRGEIPYWRSLNFCRKENGIISSSIPLDQCAEIFAAIEQIPVSTCTGIRWETSLRRVRANLRFTARTRETFPNTCSPLAIRPDLEWMRRAPEGIDLTSLGCLDVEPSLALEPPVVKMALDDNGQVDAALLVNAENCSLPIDFLCGKLGALNDFGLTSASCTSLLSNGVAGQLGGEPLRAVEDAVSPQLLPFFNYQPGWDSPYNINAAPGQPCGLTDENCRNAIRQHHLPASMTRMVWGWFGGVFQSAEGPTGRYPVIGVNNETTVVQYLVDQDGDGKLNSVDNCPNAYNPDQKNSDGDLFGDACDQCPFNSEEVDPWNDGDRDGVCPAVDNCPAVFNPLQTNANLPSEQAHNARRMGDACEPVPTPAFTAELELEEVSPNGNQSCFPGSCYAELTQGNIALTPLGSRGAGFFPADPGQNGQEIPVTVPSTDYRYCLDRKEDPINILSEIKCDDPINTNDDLVKIAFADETNDTIYRRIRLGSISKQFLSQWGERIYGGNATYQPVTWDFANDFQDWRALPFGNLWVPDWNQFNANTQLFPGGSGRFWMHAATLVGQQGDTSGLRTVTGVHPKLDGSDGEQLANSYQSMFPFSRIALTKNLWNVAVPPPSNWIKICPTCPLGFEQPGDIYTNPDIFSSWLMEQPGGGLLVQGPQGKWGFVGAKGSFLEVSNPPLTENARTVLAQSSRLVGRVEANPMLGKAPWMPETLGLGPDGVSILGKLYRGPAGMVGERDLPLRRTTASAGEQAEDLVPTSELAEEVSLEVPSARLDAVPVYSAVTGQLFLVGGRTGNNQWTGEVWAGSLGMPAEPIVWHPLSLEGYQPRKVLASTYQNNSLWVLDETTQGLGSKARLTRIHPETGQVQTLAQWPRLGLMNRHWLLQDPDGQLLLVASSQLLKTHLVFRLNPTDTGVEAKLVWVGKGWLEVEPSVSTNGYAFLTRMNKNKDPNLVRTKTLALKSPAWPLGLKAFSGCF
jgi:hypothetical protein